MCYAMQRQVLTNEKVTFEKTDQSADSDHQDTNRVTKGRDKTILTENKNSCCHLVSNLVVTKSLCSSCSIQFLC